MSGRPTERNGTVYIVDRDEGLRSSIALLVAHLAAVEMFTSAEELLNRAQFHPPACVVTDVSLPGMSGLDLLKHLKERLLGGIPVIFVATHSDVPTAVQAVRLGALDFLEKPFVGRVLLKRVEAALQLSLGAAPTE